MNKTLPTPTMATACHQTGLALYAQKKFQEAVVFFEKGLKGQPGWAEAWHNLGLTYRKLDRFSDAENAFFKAVELKPDHLAARFHLGCLLMQKDNFSEALNHFLMIIEPWPNHPETLTNLATCYLKTNQVEKAGHWYEKALVFLSDDPQILFNLGVINATPGKTDAAIQFYQRATQVNPDYFEAWHNMALLLLAKQHYSFAIQCLEEAHRLQPDHAAVNHLLGALKNNPQIKSASSDYITALFDGYADHYEPHLLTVLDYSVPQLFLQAVKQCALKSPPFDVLDIGCGTGLCGAPFRDMARTLQGIDLSEKMLDRARGKNCYDQLTQADALDFLTHSQLKFDLILAGDVLVYYGCLDDLFRQIHETLRPDGLFVFNTEISEEKEYQIRPSGRFGHSLQYLAALADRYHFKILQQDRITSRTQHHAPAEGFLVVFSRRP